MRHLFTQRRLSVLLSAVAALALLALVAALIPAPWNGSATRTADPRTTEPRTATAGSTASAPPSVPRPEHTVVVVFENKTSGHVLGSSAAPYFNHLADRGAVLTHSYGVAHPSQPNYLALFSGSTHGVTDDSCPRRFATADNLGRQLAAAGLSFAGYAESLPSAGYTGCSRGDYRRKHNPWVDFGTVPASANQPFSAFPTDFSTLPTVSFVTPNMCHDMHNCSVATGDTWLKTHLSRYASWALTHHSLLVVTFDENEGGTSTPIATIVFGQSVRPGRYATRTTHYTLLRTIEQAYGLPALGHAAAVAPLTGIWTTSPPQVINGLTNGTFESGLAGWTVAGKARLSTTKRHHGARAAVADYRPGVVGDTVIAQRFVARADTLTVWYAGECAENPKNAWLKVTLRRISTGKVTTVVARTCQRSGFHKATVKLAVGHWYALKLINHDDGRASSPNRSYFDDVSLS